MGSTEDGSAASMRDSHDFANVASFSELPFLRSASARDHSASGIRLFGIDVPHAPSESKLTKEITTAAAATTQSSNTTSTGSSSTTIAVPDSSRKFECHYCCRHFPTSQALGGHQNAHKRERQHAKRVQMQSAMAAAAASGAHHHLHGYPQHRFGVAGPNVAALYPSWPSVRGGNVASSPRFYNGLGSITQPINGNPLPAGLWRGPAAVHGNASMPHGGRRPMPLPVLRGDEPRAALLSPASSSLLVASQGQFVCEPATTTMEGVSLDLHL